MAEYILQTFGLTKQYGKNTAVNNLNMKIKKGDIYGFIGRNGAGKTTTIRMITGLVTPTSGEIELFSKKGEKDMNSGLPRIGSIIEHPALYTDFTALENMELRGKLLGIPDKRVIDGILETVGLSEVGKKKVKNFSLGMRQRLGLALALLGNPDFLILDEPINGLDPEGIVEMRKLLKRFNEEQGITILISSHILGELSQIATTYGFINNGKFIEQISADKLAEKCKQYVSVKVDDANKASVILENEFKCNDYEVLNNNEIKIFNLDTPDIINKAFVTNGIMVSELYQVGINLEDYFIDLIGGIHNA
jgi:ABC-2 type transport system ATP-binding protein